MENLDKPRKKYNWKALLIAGPILILGIVILPEWAARYFTQSRLEMNLQLRVPVLKVIEKKSPNEYQIFLDNLKNIKDSEAIARYTGEFFKTQFYSAAQKADTQACFAYLNNMLQLSRTANSKDPQYVLYIQYGNQAGIDESFAKDHQQALEALVNALLEIKSKLLEAGLNNPQPPLTEKDEEQAKLILREIVGQLNQTYGEEAVNSAINFTPYSTVDKKITADVLIKLYEMIQSRGENEAALALKYLFLKESELHSETGHVN